MNRGILFALGAYLSWGLFPLYFRQIAAVPALQIVAHRTLWSLAFVAVVLLVTRHLSWLRHVSAATWRRFTLSAALIAVNWLAYGPDVGQPVDGDQRGGQREAPPRRRADMAQP